MSVIDLRKVALALGFAAFQLHILTMTVSHFNLQLFFQMNNIPESDMSSSDWHQHRVIEAFLILAYFMFIFGLILLLILSYSNLKGNKALGVITALVLFFATCSVIVGIAVFDTRVYGTWKFSSYTTTTYVTGAACGLVGGIVLLVSLCV